MGARDLIPIPLPVNISIEEVKDDEGVVSYAVLDSNTCLVATRR